MSDKKCKSDLLLFWLTLFSPFFILPGISLFSTKINQAWPGYIVASSFHIRLRVRRGESLMALVNLWLYSIYTTRVWSGKKFRKFKKSPGLKNSWNQINQFHEFFTGQIPFFFAISKLAKNQFLNWEKVKNCQKCYFTKKKFFLIYLISRVHFFSEQTI